MTSVLENPQLARKRLRISLRYWREQRVLTQKQVAEALDWSMSKVVRIESGDVRVSMTDLRALLALYGVSGADEIARLTGLARTARRRAWYQDYPHALDQGFEYYLSYESSAEVIETFQALLIPGLLQTEDYARKVIEAGRIVDPAEGVSLRLARQAMLAEPDGPSFRCVLDEAALHREVGGPVIMRQQLLQLRAATRPTASARPKVSVGIIPFAAGAHAAMSESFTLLSLEAGQEDVLFQEAATRTVTTRENVGLVAGYRRRFEFLRAAAVEGEQAERLIDAVLLRLSEAAPMESRAASSR
jgi:transcriptional regulator with XRE-family HTH domain